MLTNREVEHIAKLARIKISEQERETFKGELSRILDYVNKLNEANTDGVEPLAQVTGLLNSIRSDEPRPATESKVHLIDQAPHHENNFVKVRSILKKTSDI